MDEEGIGIEHCQTCADPKEDNSFDDCGEVSTSSGPTPPGPVGPRNLLPEGVFEGPQTAPSPEGPTELTPQVDCAQNPDDPLCETARIPEAVEQPDEQQSSEDGENSEDNSN